MKLAVIGKGGSSKVYKVLARDMNIYAIKRVNMNGDPSIVESYMNEIDLLKRLLTKRNIIKLIDSEINMQQSVIYLVSCYQSITSLLRFLSLEKLTLRMLFKIKETVLMKTI